MQHSLSVLCGVRGCPHGHLAALLLACETHRPHWCSCASATTTFTSLWFRWFIYASSKPLSPLVAQCHGAKQCTALSLPCPCCGAPASRVNGADVVTGRHLQNSFCHPVMHEQRHLLQALRPARRCHCPVPACSAVVGFIMLPQASSIQLAAVHTRARVSRCTCPRQTYVSFSAKCF
jgi:hypothetical protein